METIWPNNVYVARKVDHGRPQCESYTQICRISAGIWQEVGGQIYRVFSPGSSSRAASALDCSGRANGSALRNSRPATERWTFAFHQAGPGRAAEGLGIGPSAGRAGAGRNLIWWGQARAG